MHGGELFTKSVLITDDVLKGIEDICDLAPLHNPAAVQSIRACRDVFGDTPQVAVFDTAFHQTMHEKAYMYGPTSITKNTMCAATASTGRATAM